MALTLAALSFHAAAAYGQDGAVPPGPADEAALFSAAGFKQADDGWSTCEIDSTSRAPAWIEQYGDFNADGHADAIVMEGSAICFGNVGTRFVLLTRDATGAWVQMLQSLGMPRFLDTAGAGGWPDVEIGGPGFCYRIMRWNGTAYTSDRFEYEGAACTP